MNECVLSQPSADPPPAPNPVAVKLHLVEPAALSGKGTLYAVSGGAQPGIYDIWADAQAAGAWQQQGGPCSKYLYNTASKGGVGRLHHLGESRHMIGSAASKRCSRLARCCAALEPPWPS